MKNKLKVIIIFLFIVLLIFIFINYLDIRKERSKTIHNSSMFIKNSNLLTEYKEKYNNNDIIGSIKIDGTNIDNLLVKGIDNEYYLSHDLNKKYSEKGTIYVDYRTNLNSKQINIYGHNSIYYTDLPFTDLEKYIDYEFYKNHKYINIWDGIENYLYEIFSVQIVSDEYEHMNIQVDTNHITKLKDSIYNTFVDVTEKDYILILQTCNYNPKNSYILVNAKRL